MNSTEPHPALSLYFWSRLAIGLFLLSTLIFASVLYSQQLFVLESASKPYDFLASPELSSVTSKRRRLGPNQSIGITHGESAALALSQEMTSFQQRLISLKEDSASREQTAIGTLKEISAQLTSKTDRPDDSASPLTIEERAQILTEVEVNSIEQRKLIFTTLSSTAARDFFIEKATDRLEKSGGATRVIGEYIYAASLLQFASKQTQSKIKPKLLQLGQANKRQITDGSTPLDICRLQELLGCYSFEDFLETFRPIDVAFRMQARSPVHWKGPFPAPQVLYRASLVFDDYQSVLINASSDRARFGYLAYYALCDYENMPTETISMIANDLLSSDEDSRWYARCVLDRNLPDRVREQLFAQVAPSVVRSENSLKKQFLLGRDLSLLITKKTAKSSILAATKLNEDKPLLASMLASRALQVAPQQSLTQLGNTPQESRIVPLDKDSETTLRKRYPSETDLWSPPEVKEILSNLRESAEGSIATFLESTADFENEELILSAIQTWGSQKSLPILEWQYQQRKPSSNRSKAVWDSVIETMQKRERN